MTAEVQLARKNTFALAAIFVLSVCIGMFLFLAPALIIRPFKFQSARGLNFAMVARQHAPMWSLVIAIGNVILAAIITWTVHL